jgi:hypothetical protein
VDYSLLMRCGQSLRNLPPDAGQTSATGIRPPRWIR